MQRQTNVTLEILKIGDKKKIEKLKSDLRLSVIVHQNYGHFRLKRLNC